MLRQFFYSLLQDMNQKTQDAILWSLALFALPFMLYYLLLQYPPVGRFVHQLQGGSAIMDPWAASNASALCLFGFLVLVIMLVPALIVATIKRAVVNKPTPLDTFGSAHFASEYEARALLPSPQQLATGEPFLLLGTAYGRIAALDQRRQESHVLLVAPTGQGKTSGIIIPGLLGEMGKRSLFINDTKSELIGQCYGWLARHHSCFVLSPTRPEYSHHYNPLAHIGNMEDAEDLAAAIVMNTGESKEPFWNNASRLLLTACILHIKAADPHAPFSRFVQMVTATKLDDLKTLLMNSPSPLAQSAATSFLQSLALNDRLSGSIMVELATRLYSMNDPAITSITTANDIDFDAFINRPTAIFLAIPASQSKRLKWFSACFIMQLMKHLTKKAEEAPTRRLARPAALYLDEFGNQNIPHFPEHVSLVRSAGIALIMAIQSHGQLVGAYEEEGKSTILANATTHVVFPGCGLPETSYYAERSGEMTIATMTKSSSGGMGLTVSHGQARRQLMTSDEIRRMPERSLLVITDNVAPLIVRNFPYFEMPQLKARASMPYQLPHRRATQALPPQTPTPAPQGPAPQPKNSENLFLP